MRRTVFAAIALAGLLVHNQATGQVVAWGDNTYGQTTLPPGLSNVVSVATGGRHCLALRANGSVVGWGDNTYSQRTIPTDLSNVVAIAAGGDHSLALTAEGLVRAWGKNSDGRTMVPTGLSNVIAVAAGGIHSLALTAHGQVVGWGDNYYGQTNVPAGLSNVVAIAAGLNFNVALTAEGRVRAWGDNRYNQCNVPSGLSNAVAVAAGQNHGLALQTGGTVVAWGTANVAIQVPAGLSNVAAVATGMYHSLALRTDGRLVAWGTGSQTNVPVSLSNIVRVAAALNVSLALTGSPSPTIVQQPLSRIAYPGDTELFRVDAIGAPPLSYQWRANGTNLLDGGQVSGASTPTLLLTGVQTNDAADYSVVVSNASGSVTSAVARLTFWPPLATALNTNLTWTTGGTKPWLVHDSVTHDGAYAARSGGITNNQTTWIQTELTGPGLLSFWWKVSSEVGYDFLKCFMDGVQVAAIAGEVDWERRLVCLGAGTHTLRWEYAKDDLVNSGQDAGWLDEVSFTPGGTAPEIQVQPNGTNLSAGLTATFKVQAFGTPPLVSLWLRNGTTLAVTSNDTFTVANVQASHEGDYQVIVTNDFGAVTSRVVTLMVTPSMPIITSQPKSQGALRGRRLDFGVGVRGSEPLVCQWMKDGTQMVGATNAALPFVEFSDGDVGEYWVIVTNAYGAVTSSVARLAITRVAAWGLNHVGQADVPASTTNVVAVSAGLSFSVALRADGSVVAWGENSHGQLGVPSGLSNVVAIAAGQLHCLALRADGTVAAWGAGTNNSGGQNLGQSLVPAGLSHVVVVAAGLWHSLVVRVDGTVVAWGNAYNVPAGLSNVVAADGGFSHSLVLRADGTVVIWGEDSFHFGTTNMPPGLGNIVALS